MNDGVSPVLRQAVRRRYYLVACCVVGLGLAVTSACAPSGAPESSQQGEDSIAVPEQNDSQSVNSTGQIHESSEGPTPPQHRDAMAKDLYGIFIPEGAQLLEVTRQAMFVEWVYVYCELTGSAVEEFLAKNLSKTMDDLSSHGGNDVDPALLAEIQTLVKDLDWWDPGMLTDPQMLKVIRGRVTSWIAVEEQNSGDYLVLFIRATD